MKEIVFIIPNLVGGGAERVMSILANYLSKSNYKVSILLTKSNIVEYELDKKIEVIVNNGKNSPIGQMKFIRNCLKKKKEGVCISFLTYQNIYMLIATIGLPIKKVVSERNDPARTLYGKKWLGIVRNVIYNWANNIVFQTTGAKEYFPNEIQKKGVIILNPINNTLSVEDCIKKKEIVAVGRLTEQKNYPLLFNAFADFSKLYPDYTLKIYGEGELKNKLQDLAYQLKIEEKVKFMGFCKDIHKKISNAEMFVMTSKYEGLSNALLEAMALGLSCISTDSPPGGARMVIQNGENGILIKNNDKAGLVQALCKLAGDKKYARQLGKKATSIKNQLSTEKICKEWIDLIESYDK